MLKNGDLNRQEQTTWSFQISDDIVQETGRGRALQERCEKLLAQAEARVEKITLDEKGAPKGVAPLDPSE